MHMELRYTWDVKADIAIGLAPGSFAITSPAGKTMSLSQYEAVTKHLVSHKSKPELRRVNRCAKLGMPTRSHRRKRHPNCLPVRLS